MLVLSRRVDETLELPDIGFSLQVLSVKGNRVKVGIQAPKDIRVLRGEFCPENVRKLPTRSGTHVLSREEFHNLRNHMNAISLALHLFRRQRDAGLHDAAEATLNRLFEQLGEVQGSFVTSNSPVGLQALLVEDDRNERELLAGLLRMSGYNVVTAGDGLDALEYLKTHDLPDVVLLDMRMPRCDGPTTIARIRKDPNMADLRVFAVSATRPSDLGVATGAGGVDGWFAKPLNPEVLARQIRRIALTASA